MTVLLLMADPVVNMFGAFSSEAMGTFFQGLQVLGLGMTTTIAVLALFYLIIKLMIKLFPSKE